MRLAERARALDSIFACGGEVEVAAPLSLRGPDGKRLEIAEHIGWRPTHVGRKLRAWCGPASFGEGAKTRSDARVRLGQQLYARDGSLAVEGLDEALRDILHQVRAALCPDDEAPPDAELHALNLYGPGGHFIPHKDTPREPGVFGTLVICLPLAFSGGRLVVEQQARATFDWETCPGSLEFARDARRIRWAAFFGDVDHHIEKVTSGCRATLTYDLRRGTPAPSAGTNGHSQLGEAGTMFAAVLAEALSDPHFVPDGGRFGIPCLHLYVVPSDREQPPDAEGLPTPCLKGRDRLIASALELAGIKPRVVPYVFETNGGDSWRLHRAASAKERHVFTQKRLRGASLRQNLPIEFHADVRQSDDVTWLVRPPWISKYREPGDGRPEPAVDFLGEVEYSATGYFGNEASDVAFYASAAILFDVPAVSERACIGRNLR
ncbi:MAG: hypothetical protein VKP57_02800 [Candidatus Sericytochromatia bacterium]|nr:hypothetical protein [Candidatus Sericytochromatia bacterium]